MIALLIFYVVQQGNGEWIVGRVGRALEDKNEYQQMLSDGKRKMEAGSSDQLNEVSTGSAISCHITQHQLRLERAREVEQRLITDLQQLTIEKEQVCLSISHGLCCSANCK